MKVRHQGAVMATAAIALLGSACGQDAETDRSDERTSPTADSPAPAPEEAGLDGRARWAVASLDDWEFSVFDQDGVFQVRNADTECQITYRQALGPEPEGGTEQVVSAYVDELRGTAGEVQPSDGGVEMSFGIGLTGAEGTTGPFPSQTVTYTGQDDIDYVNTIAAQRFADVEMLVIAACPSRTWSDARASIEEHVDATYVVPAD